MSEDQQPSGAPSLTMQDIAEELSFDLSMKKKKKKAVSSATAAATTTAHSTASAPVTSDVMDQISSTATPTVASEESTSTYYLYKELVSRFYSTLREHNPDLALGNERRGKFTLVPPDVVREGSKKSAFQNLPDIARRLHRTTEHLTQFILAELGTTGNTDSQGRLLIRGRFQGPQLEAILRKYIVEYVTCKTCRAAETQLVKDNRLYFVQCEVCGSQRSVSAIKTGFTAQTAKRATQRAAATQ